MVSPTWGLGFRKSGERMGLGVKGGSAIQLSSTMSSVSCAVATVYACFPWWHIESHDRAVGLAVQ